jgi:hypothetical protein
VLVFVPDLASHLIYATRMLAFVPDFASHCRHSSHHRQSFRRLNFGCRLGQFLIGHYSVRSLLRLGWSVCQVLENLLIWEKIVI